MELHTLGVDGGYTQRDVTELARIFTGWTLDARAGGENALFVFTPRRHDQGGKVWLGQTVAENAVIGLVESEWALDVLARQPATARHVGRKLAEYFVSDTPPRALVDRLAGRFLATDGDIREVLATLFVSPEFRDPAIHGAKFKSPYRYVLSAVRACGRRAGE